jgi:hypothetical protein
VNAAVQSGLIAASALCPPSGGDTTSNTANSATTIAAINTLKDVDPALIASIKMTSLYPSDFTGAP